MEGESPLEPLTSTICGSTESRPPVGTLKYIVFYSSLFCLANTKFSIFKVASMAAAI